MQGIQKDYSYSKEDIDNMRTNLQNQINTINNILEWNEY